MALFAGALETVAATITAQATTNRPVVKGWPGAREAVTRAVAAAEDEQARRRSGRTR